VLAGSGWTSCGGTAAAILVPESVACVTAVALAMPGIPQWVVTQKPGLAAMLPALPNVYVHFSTDRSSMPRLDEMRRLAPSGLRWFWSYQCDKGEVPPDGVAPVVFRNHYERLGTAEADPPTDGDCPLNYLRKIDGACRRCRRCFDGTAVAEAEAWQLKS
jgi:hypothetical protein